MTPYNDLTRLLGLEPSNWMMSPSERLAILGLLWVIKPSYSLEFGCADGGLTQWLSQFSAQVVTVDIDAKLMAVTQPYPNVTPLCMSTQDAAHWINANKKHFDFTIIDADHSREGMRGDLSNALGFSDIIIVHDTYYPPCRQGILDALAHRDVYYDLELVPGGLQPDGMWGGLGIVISLQAVKTKTFVTPRLSLYQWLRWFSQMQQRKNMMRYWLRRLYNKAGRLKGRLGNFGQGSRQSQ
jgi:hypothetical protein